MLQPPEAFGHEARCKLPEYHACSTMSPIYLEAVKANAHRGPPCAPDPGWCTSSQWIVSIRDPSYGSLALFSLRPIRANSFSAPVPARTRHARQRQFFFNRPAATKHLPSSFPSIPRRYCRRCCCLSFLHHLHFIHRTASHAYLLSGTCLPTCNKVLQQASPSLKLFFHPNFAPCQQQVISTTKA